MGREAFLWIPGDLKDDVFGRFGDLFEGVDAERILSLRWDLPGRGWDFIILDRFRTPDAEFIFWSGLGPVIGIDEGGRRRNRFDFLIDLLPSLLRREPNLNAPYLLPLPKNRGPEDFPGAVPVRALISFGAEDSAGLGSRAARVISARKAANRLDITLIAGRGRKLAGVNVTGKFPGLKEHLAEYDLLITHFGLGAFEAVYARLPVLLISPTAYHEKLARNAGFFSLGRGGRGLRRLGICSLNREFLEGLKKRTLEIARRYGLEKDQCKKDQSGSGQREDMGFFINSLSLRAPRNCPACGGKAGPAAGVLARFPEETYRRCPRCGLIYLSRLNAPPVEYERDYFFGFYKKQYGKTYLEDFPNLKETGRRRLAHIGNLLPGASAGLSLLDIGCAYGPFLAAAAEAGFSPSGVEPAEDAARYVKEELGFPAWRGVFPDALPGEFRHSREAGFDVITLWYVLEHFKEPGQTLREIHRLLKDGGVLAFSTPSFSGISGRKHMRAFLKSSPPDHWTVWSPGICKKILGRYGFRLRRIVVTGHHPERFPVLGRFIQPDKKGTLRRLLLRVSRLFGLGDTFEVYALKAALKP
jgi:SAM-dependent methyltransferase